jgi:hypothetical protein
LEATNQCAVRPFFEDLFKLFVKHHYLPSNIYNFDESSLRCDEPWKTHVISPWSDPVLTSATDSIASTTFALCIAANGEKLESLLILNEKYAKLADVYERESIIVKVSPSGWINKELFTMFMENTLLPHIVKRLERFLLFTSSCFFTFLVRPPEKEELSWGYDRSQDDGEESEHNPTLDEDIFEGAQSDGGDFEKPLKESKRKNEKKDVIGKRLRGRKRRRECEREKEMEGSGRKDGTIERGFPILFGTPSTITSVSIPTFPPTFGPAPTPSISFFSHQSSTPCSLLSSPASSAPPFFSPSTPSSYVSEISLTPRKHLPTTFHQLKAYHTCPPSIQRLDSLYALLLPWLKIPRFHKNIRSVCCRASSPPRALFFINEIK